MTKRQKKKKVQKTLAPAKTDVNDDGTRRPSKLMARERERWRKVASAWASFTQKWSILAPKKSLPSKRKNCHVAKCVHNCKQGIMTDTWCLRVSAGWKEMQLLQAHNEVNEESKRLVSSCLRAPLLWAQKRNCEWRNRKMLFSSQSLQGIPSITRIVRSFLLIGK